MTTRYELIIYWSKDDKSFVVEVPELPGCMADGQTYSEAVANAEVVIDEWIETAPTPDSHFPHLRGKGSLNMSETVTTAAPATTAPPASEPREKLTKKAIT